MDALWTEINQGHLRATCLWLGFTELVWVLQRRRNTGVLNPHAFATVYQQFRRDCEQVAWIGLSWGQVQASVAWIVKHNLNSTDALHLQAALLEHAATPKGIWLVSSDRRLLRAAHAEGLQTLNPEQSSITEIQKLLANTGQH